MPVPCAELIGPVAVMSTVPQPVLVATMPLEPGPVVVIAPVLIVWSPPVVVTSTPSESAPLVVIAPPVVSTTTGPSPPSTSTPGESSPVVVTGPVETVIGPVPLTPTPRRVVASRRDRPRADHDRTVAAGHADAR